MIVAWNVILRWGLRMTSSESFLVRDLDSGDNGIQSKGFICDTY